MSIIPNIPRPTIAPNRFAETAITGSLLIEAGTTAYATGRFIRLFSSGDRFIPEVRVDGTVWAAMAGNVAAGISGFYITDIIINGTVAAIGSVATSEFRQANAYAVSNSSLGRSVTNNGTIYAYTDGGIAQALSHWGPDVMVTNNGLIAGHSGTGSEVAASQALGVYMVNGGFVHNTAGGRILAEGVNATGIIMGRGIVGPLAGVRPSILNDGTIQAVSIGGAPSVGISMASLAVETFVIRNNGLIAADVAIRTGSATWPPTASDVTIENRASGVIRGNIEGDLGSERVFNAGRIEGNLLLGDGADIFDNTLGVHIGWASLGWGEDSFFGGDGAERVDGGRMNDRLSGGGGNDLLLGGLGADRLDGGAGNDGLYGDYGDDVLLLAGADRAFGGQGNDRFELADLAFALIDGGEGRDVLAIGTLSGTIDLAAVLASSRVSGIEGFDLGTTGRAAIAAGDAGAGLHGLRIDGSAGASLTLAGGWAAAGQESVGGIGYNLWRTGSTTISVRAGVSVTLATAMPSDTRGLDAVAAGAASPLLADEPSFALANPLWINPRYAVIESITIGAEETWRSDGSAVLMTAFAMNASVTNAGTLESNVGGRLISVDQLTRFTNSGTIRSVTTQAGGSSVAYQSNQTAPLFNSGTILAEGPGGATAVELWSNGSREARAFENSGWIQTTSSGGAALGVVLVASGINANAGDILATGATRATAVQFARDGEFVNIGRIEAVQTDATFNRASAALLFTSITQGFRLTNAGSITATMAIRVLDEFNYNDQGPLDIANEASGQITGEIRLDGTRDTIVNRGTITGNVSLGAGDDVFDSRGGTFIGTINGGDGGDWIHAGAGNHTVNGGTNVDTFAVAGTRSQYTVTQTATGVFQVVGPDGTDTLTAIEFLQFDDQTIRLRPGTGVAVNFNTADRSVYQSAMNDIRDFDGNALGGNGGWLRIGQADVNGDGDIDQILVNRTIGRFATVGTAPDGLVYFSDHGWAGETRVAGIYIDPLVEAGIVVRGSDQDSQRRFQNDLFIENINRVLGANDYNRDGIQEVYFALTDGTAYLRALMHADGNIRYANYQSQQEVIDYLTANGFGPDTWAGWFPQPSEGAGEVPEGETIVLADDAAPGFVDMQALALATPMLVPEYF